MKYLRHNETQWNKWGALMLMKLKVAYWDTMMHSLHVIENEVYVRKNVPVNIGMFNILTNSGYISKTGYK